MPVEKFGNYLSTLILVMFVFGAFILAAILRIRENKKKLEAEPESSNLPRLGIILDSILLICALCFLCFVMTMILEKF